MIHARTSSLSCAICHMGEAGSIACAERTVGYDTESDRFQGRVRDHTAGRATALVAEADGRAIGYIHVYWRAEHGPFAGTDVPGIIDFGVPEDCRRAVSAQSSWTSPNRSPPDAATACGWRWA